MNKQEKEKFAKMILKQNKARLDKYREFLINSHDIRQHLKTQEKEIWDISKCKSQEFSIFHVINSFHNKNFSTKQRLFTSTFFIPMEISRDLRTSIHLAEFAYYKVANSTLRNVMENVFRLLYFRQFPLEINKFEKSKFEKIWCCSLVKPFKQKSKFKYKKDFLKHCNELSIYIHSLLKTFGNNIFGLNVYKPKLFKEWLSNYKKTIGIIEKVMS